MISRATRWRSPRVTASISAPAAAITTACVSSSRMCPAGSLYVIGLVRVGRRSSYVVLVSRVFSSQWCGSRDAVRVLFHDEPGHRKRAHEQREAPELPAIVRGGDEQR